MEAQLLDRRIPPAAAPLVKVPFPKVQLAELNNGIPVHWVRFGNQEIVEIRVIYPAGRSFETAAGISMFTGKMIQEGTKNYTGLEFAKKLDEYGAYISVETGYDSSTVSLTTLAKHVPSTVPLLAELLLEPAFVELELEKLKARTIQHLDVEEKKTEFTARKEFNRLLHGNDHPYGRVSEKSDVAAVKIDQLKAFYQRYFSLVNARIVACGYFDLDNLMSHLNAGLGGADLIDRDRKVDMANSLARTIAPSNPTGLHYFEKAETMQATVRVGFRSFPRQHPDYWPMQVVNTILGGYFGSRLMKNIREDKGYTYGVGSAWLCMKYSGSFLIQTDVGNEYIESTLKEIRKEMQKLVDDGVESEELALVKNFMLGRSASARETPSQIAGLIKVCLVNELPFSVLDDKFDMIQAVTPEVVQELAAKYFQQEKLLEVVSGKMG